jgi:RNA polymerase sigma-70 factor (ECF subfamily)
MTPGREPLERTGVHPLGTDRPAREGELVERVRAGNADAFEELARDVAPRLYRLAVHLTGRPEEAEDLVQETLVRALPALRRFEGRSSLSTYLVRALSNLWKNRLRSRSRSRIVGWLAIGSRREEPGSVDLDPPDGAPSAHERLESEDRAASVRAAVAKLEPDRRLVLLLREVEERSYEEIAELTGVPVGTVRSRLARARDDLRRLLGDGS